MARSMFKGPKGMSLAGNAAAVAAAAAAVAAAAVAAAAAGRIQCVSAVDV